MKGTTTSAISDSEAVNQPYLVVVGGNSAGNRAVLASLLKGLERRGTVAFILAEPLATKDFPMAVPSALRRPSTEACPSPIIFTSVRPNTRCRLALAASK